jgi:hypothetical protein
MSFGGGGGTDTVTQTSQQLLAPEQKELLGSVIPRAKAFVDQPPVLYPESTVTGFNPQQLQAQNLALDTAATTLPSAINNQLAAQAFLSGPVLDTATNPALAKATEAAIRPITENYLETALPQIRSGAIQAGQLGGSRQGVAESNVTRDYLRQIGDTAAQFQNIAYGQGLDAQTKALLASPELIKSALLPTQVIGGVGDVRAQKEQSFLTEAAQRYVNEQVLPFSAAQDVASLAFGIGGGGATSQSTAPSPQVSPIAGGLGGGTLGAMLGNLLVPGAGAGVGGTLGALVGALYA